MIDKPIQLAVLISGSGTTLQNLIDRIGDGSLKARIAVVIASRAGIGGIERAQRAALRCEVAERGEGFSRRVFEICDEAKVDLVCLAGWLSLLEVPARYSGRVINIHPALLPEFGGKGMYGRRVHEAVLKAGKNRSGCTVHFVDQTYDSGPIILRRECAVLAGDTAESLATRVFEAEKLAYPQAIRLIAAGKIRLEGGTVRRLGE